MKKKTRSRLSNNLSVTFCVAIFICLLGAAGNFCGFYKSFTFSLSKMNEDPIATITFKYKTAQRKIYERLVWDRLRQESPLYNGDTIHTSNASEATVTFTDGNKIELFESTMIQIWKDDKAGKSSTEVYDGSVYVESGDKENADGVFLKADGGNVSIDMEKDGSSTVDLSKGGFVQVVSGNVSVSNSEGIVKSLSEGESLGTSAKEFMQPVFTMLSPSPNKKILNHSKEGQQIDFRWKKSGMAEDVNLVLEISKGKGFTMIEDSAVINDIDDYSAILDSDNYFWRIRNTKETDSAKAVLVSSRLNIIQSLPPECLSPVQDYEYKFRTRKPAIRFIWTETNRADSYRFIVADNEAMNSPVIDQRLSSTSAIISSLKEGVYFWQVIPYFTTNKEGFNAPSKVYSFTITKSGTLNIPTPLIPSDNSVVNIEKTAKKTYFSWKTEPEAVNYKIEFSKSADFAKVEKTIESSSNYVSLNSAEVFSAGRWFWRIAQFDNEGNNSKKSEPFSFYAMEGKPEQHTVEPVDGFGIAENLMLDLNFTWKKNLPDFYKSYIQIAKDANFNSLVYSSQVTGFSLSGIHLPKGTYYWRLSSKSTLADFEINSSAKVLNVLSNLDATSIIAPLGKAVARDTVPYKFQWKEVEDADFYKVNIYRLSDGKLVHEDIVYGTDFELDMFHPKDFVDRTDYKIEIQAKSNAIPGLVSRRNGELYESVFHLVKLRPVEIKTPKKKAKFEGIDVVFNKVNITWYSVDAVSEAQVEVVKLSEEEPLTVVKIPSDEEFAKGNKVAPSSVLIENPDLRNGGDYEVIVHAKTLDGIDISNTDKKYIGQFSISPVEPLQMASELKCTPAIYDAAYLRNKENTRDVKFSWQHVKNATDYRFEIKSPKGKSIYKKTLTGKTEVKVNWPELIQSQKSKADMRKLYQGNFTWTVEAFRRIDLDNDGILETEIQPGVIAESVLVVDVPSLKKTSGRGAKNPYGK